MVSNRKMKDGERMLLDRIRHLSDLGRDWVLPSSYDSEGYPRVSLPRYMEFTNPSLALIEEVFGSNSVYYRHFNSLCDQPSVDNCEACLSILNSIEEQIMKGWFTHYRDLVSAEIFTDFMDMAEYLLDEGYKDASAVITGSTLESHLRKLCDKNDIETYYLNGKGDRVPKNADTLNNDLCKKDAYNKLVQKSITAWLDLRNKAAHGKYDEYTKDDVRLMYSGVLNFISTTK